MNNPLQLFDRGITNILHGVQYVGHFPLSVIKDKRFNKKTTSVREQIIFMKRLSMMLKSGMPIVYCLRLIALEKKSTGVSLMAADLVTAVESGRSLFAALIERDAKISPIVVSLVRIGEATGTLPDSLEYLALELKVRQEVKRQIISALVYPAIIVVATLGIAVFLILYIFPKITPIFIGLHAELPLSTRMLLGLSQILSSYGWYIIGVIITVVLLWPVVTNVPTVRRRLDRMLLSLPIFGRLVQYYNVANMSRTLGLLLASDVRIIESIQIVATCAPHMLYVDALTTVASRVATGQQLSVELEKYPLLFPTLVTQMVASGEKTGNLSSTLSFLSTMYESDIRDLTKNLTTILEPILMLTMGLIVGFIAISIITPIYGITQNLHP